MDGAAWLQDLIDEQRPDAVRILDFPHAVGYLAKAAQAAFGPGSREAAVWLDEWAPKLKTDGPDEVLAALRQLPVPDLDAATVRRKTMAYLRQRRAQLAYASFQEQGYPIGSGSAESACKLVVEARMKGSGMHWKRANVSPMLAVRAIACSQRWDHAWPRIWASLRTTALARRHARWRERHATPSAPPPQPEPPRPTILHDDHPTRHPWRGSRPLPKTWACRPAAIL